MSLSRRESWSADRDRCGAAWAGPSEIVGGGSILCSSRCAFCISRGAFRPRDVRFALENDGWNCTFECEVHVSAPGKVIQGVVLKEYRVRVRR